MAMSVCVFCSGKSDAPARYIDAAADFGRAAALAGFQIVFGGGGSGMMGALAEAATRHGADVVGVMPQALIEREHSQFAAGRRITTGDLAERKATMFTMCDAVVVLPGGLGTLDELFEIWTLGPQLRVYDLPIVLVNTDGFYDGLLAWLWHHAGDGAMMHDRILESVAIAATTTDAITLLKPRLTG